MRILTSDQMRAVDRRIIEELGLPGLVLMENAALGVVDGLVRLFPGAERISVLCGPGNNGGDGLAVARHVLARGTRARVFLAAPADRLGGDAAAELDLCRRLGIAVSQVVEESEVSAFLAVAARSDVVVDALFGTGLTRPLEGRFAGLVEGLNALTVPVLAVDLPSGLDASRDEPIGPAVEATATVTFAAPKVAHVFSPAARHSGVLLVSDLGVPSTFVDEAEGDVIYLLEEDEMAALLRVRAPDSHKGTYGHVLVVAGSRGKAGAAVLCCRGALRAGAGLVTAAVPDRLVEVVHGSSLETMTQAVGEAGGERLDASAWGALEAAAVGKSALAVGPGLGTASETCEVVRRFVVETAVPLVLDADGLNAFAPPHGGRPEALEERRAPTILTPHPGELARLLDCSTSDVQGRRREVAREAAGRTGAVVVLKGHQTLVADPEGAVSVSTTGNAGMATAGSGDVLTGILAGLLAQGYEAGEAARLGVFAHGLAGDQAARESSEESLTAGDILGALPPTFRRLHGDEPP